MRQTNADTFFRHSDLDSFCAIRIFLTGAKVLGAGLDDTSACHSPTLNSGLTRLSVRALDKWKKRANVDEVDQLIDTPDLRSRLDASYQNASGKSALLMLHSYSFSVQRLRLGCWHTAHDARDLIEQCTRFYARRFCLFTCPSECAYADAGELLWQVATAHYRYVLTSVVCQAAMHSRSYPSGVLYVDDDDDEAECRRPLFEAASSGTIANGWPPSIGPLRTQHNTTQCFRFRLNRQALLAVNSSTKLDTFFFIPFLQHSFRRLLLSIANMQM